MLYLTWLTTSWSFLASGVGVSNVKVLNNQVLYPPGEAGNDQLKI